PLVLVHGSGNDSRRWDSVIPFFELGFTIFAMDRRGRGESLDSDAYSIQREFEDVAALIEMVDESVNVLGHSFGAICTLGAALLTAKIHKLVLYEPPIVTPGVRTYPAELVDQLQTLVDAGDLDTVITTFMVEVTGVPAHEAAQARSLPSWSARRAAAH